MNLAISRELKHNLRLQVESYAMEPRSHGLPVWLDLGGCRTIPVFQVDTVSPRPDVTKQSTQARYEQINGSCYHGSCHAVVCSLSSELHS